MHHEIAHITSSEYLAADYRVDPIWTSWGIAQQIKGTAVVRSFMAQQIIDSSDRDTHTPWDINWMCWSCDVHSQETGFWNSNKAHNYHSYCTEWNNIFTVIHVGTIPYTGKGGGMILLWRKMFFPCNGEDLLYCICTVLK